MGLKEEDNGPSTRKIQLKICKLFSFVQPTDFFSAVPNNLGSCYFLFYIYIANCNLNVPVGEIASLWEFVADHGGIYQRVLRHMLKTVN